MSGEHAHDAKRRRAEDGSAIKLEADASGSDGGGGGGGQGNDFANDFMAQQMHLQQ